MFTQHIDICPEHDGCVTISCVDNGGEPAWISHIRPDELPEGVTIASCANDSYPVIDRRLQ